MSKDFEAMKPREVEAYFRQLILNTFGNEIEDRADVSANKGSYAVAFSVDGETYEFRFKKKTAAKIAKAIRALK